MNNIEKIVKTLYENYPDARCSLEFNNPLELLISVMLSAQSTDAQINKLTPKLFERFKNAKDYAECDINELEKYVKSSGFYKTKARNIKTTCQIIHEKYNGYVPDTMEELTTLPGVGRKTANVVMLNAFNKCEGIAIDTHAKRISNRIGLSNHEDPLKIEQDVLKLIDKKSWHLMNHLFVCHGRATCTARNPKCGECCINEYCLKKGI